MKNIHPEDRAAANKVLDALMNDPNATTTAECRYLCKDGSYKWIEFSGINLLHDPDIRGVLGNGIDLDAHKISNADPCRARQ